MKALCIVYLHVDDWEVYGRYQSRVVPTLEPFGAKVLVRGGAFTTVEGEMPFERIVVLEFPSHDAAEAWYQSDSVSSSASDSAGGSEMSVRHCRRCRLPRDSIGFATTSLRLRPICRSG